MRKQLSIFLLSVILLTQYAKHISYMECRAANYFAANNTLPCDCNKVFADPKTTRETPDSLPRHTHLHIDENYCFSHVVWQVANQATLRKLLFPILEEAILNGVSNDCEHPPQVG